MNPPGPWGCRTATVEGGPRGRCLLPAHAAEAVPQTLSGASQVPSAHPTLHGPSKGWRLACRRAGRNERRRCQEIPHIPGSLAPGPTRRVQLGTSRTRGGPTLALGRWGNHRPHRAVGEEKKLGRGATPQDQKGKSGRRAGGLEGRAQAGDHDSRGGVSSRPGVPTPHPASPQPSPAPRLPWPGEVRVTGAY